MFIVLTGAKQNLGDFLITERCKALLREYKPDDELIQLPSWEPITDHLKKVNQSKGIIIMGGPGYRPDMYPGIYKLTPELDDIQVPIILMGMGWKGARGDIAAVKEYRYSVESIKLLQKVAFRTQYFSCRDYYTAYTLQNHGFANILMTGCPAWYDLASIGMDYNPPGSIQKIAFTPPAYAHFTDQSVQLLKVLKDIFPAAEITACFHHGYEYQGLSGNELFFQAQRNMRDAYNDLQIPCFDLSGEIDNIHLYKDCDLHVGYRVHAHIDCLSRRRTSILIHEDGRGAGVDNALGLPGVDAYALDKEIALPGLLQRIKGNIGFVEKQIVNPLASEQLQGILSRELGHNFADFQGLDRKIDHYYQIMKQFILSL